MASMIKRNDPCPCGSGLMYKKCCFGEDEQIRTDVTLLDFAGALQDNDEEIRDVKNFTVKQNQRSIADFQGISPATMQRFINFPFDSPEIAALPAPLEAAPDAPVITIFGALVDAIGEQGLKSTAKGNLPRKFCVELDASLEKDGYYGDSRRIGKVNKEDDFVDLNVTRVVAGMAGLIRKSKGKFVLSRECKNLLADHGMAGIYPRLFKTYALKFNWGYLDGYEDLYFIQRSFMFSLYLLNRYGDSWQDTAFYEDCFLRAFPEYMNELPAKEWITPEQQLRNVYSWRTFNRFAGFMGLITLKSTLTTQPYGVTYSLKKLPMLDQALQFHLSG